MNWITKFFSGDGKRPVGAPHETRPSVPTASPPRPKPVPTPAAPHSASSDLKVYAKSAEGSFRETAGDESLAGPLMALALPMYQSVMGAAKRNSINASDERELDECIGLFSKVIDVYPRYGEPFGLRGSMYMIRGQINHSRADLEAAIEDFEKALKVGAKDSSNHAAWRTMIAQIRAVKSQF
jgi:hypothetical protein